MKFLVEDGAVHSTFQIIQCTVLRRYCLRYEYVFLGCQASFWWAIYSQKEKLKKLKKLKWLKSSAF
jgi:hypothetical protein